MALQKTVSQDPCWVFNNPQLFLLLCMCCSNYWFFYEWTCKKTFFLKKKISSVFDYSSYAGNIVSLHAWKHQKHLLVPNSHNGTPVTSPNDLCLKFYSSCPTFPPAAASKCFCWQSRHAELTKQNSLKRTEVVMKACTVVSGNESRHLWKVKCSKCVYGVVKMVK